MSLLSNTHKNFMEKMIKLYQLVLQYMKIYVAIVGYIVSNLKKAISQNVKP